MTRRGGSAVLVAMAVLAGITFLLTRQCRAERGARRSLHMQAAAHAARNGQYEAAIAEYRAALKYGGGDAAARLGLAQALFSLGRFSEARNHLLDLSVAARTRGAAGRMLGDIARRQGRPHEAAAYYRLAVQARWPHDAAANRLQTRIALVELLESQGDYRQEVGELVELMKEMPDDVATRRWIGRRLLRAGAPAKAARVFQDVADANPDDPQSWADVGEAEFGNGRYLAARTAFNRSRLIDAEGVEVRHWLELCDATIDLNPTYGQAGERRRQSQLLLEWALAEARRCLATSATETDGSMEASGQLGLLVDQAEEILSHKVPASESEVSIEESLSLEERLWKGRLQICAGLAPAAEPPRHVAQKLSP